MPFGWVDNAAPYITAANLEKMNAGGAQAFTPEAYGAVRDGATVTDANITSGSGTLTSATANFKTGAAPGGSVNKYCVIIPAGGAAGFFCAQITAWTNSTTVTVSPTAPNTVTNGILIFFTDDTAAINSAVAAAAAYAATDATGNYAEVVFSPGVYGIAGALNTSFSGRAQIPLPVISTSGQKYTIALKGLCDDTTPLPHWVQNTPQTTGPTLYSILGSSLLSATYSGVTGLASVIGTPTYEQVGANNFSNLHVYISGLSIAQPQNPTGSSIDLQGACSANIGMLYATASSVPQYATNYGGGWAGGIGLRMPRVGNNDDCNILNYGCDGYSIGLMGGAHLNAMRVGVLNCQYGVCLESSPNGSSIHYLSTEGCIYHLSTSQTSFTSVALCDISIAHWDIEDYADIPTTYHIDDSQNGLYGTINVHRFNNAGALVSPLVNGTPKARIFDTTLPRGKVTTAPSIPATTVASTVIYRDCMVVLTCGAGGVSAVSIGGNATGLSGAAAAVIHFMVPSGTTVAITYPSGAPTWTWWAL